MNTGTWTSNTMLEIVQGGTTTHWCQATAQGLRLRLFRVNGAVPPDSTMATHGREIQNHSQLLCV